MKPAAVGVAVVCATIAAATMWCIKRGSGGKPVAAAGSAGSGAALASGGSATGAAAEAELGDDDATADPRYRVIDADARMALMERISAARAARAARTAGKQAPPTPAPAADDPPPLPGELTPDEIMDGIRPVLPLFEDCYKQGLERRTVKNGTVKFTIHLVGEPDIGTLVDTAELGGDPAFLADAELAQCLQETMMSIELPPMKQGAELGVITTMVFDDDPDDGSGSGSGR